MKDKNFLKACFLSASSSIFYSLFILSILKTNNISFIFFISSLILIILSFISMKYKKYKISLPKKSTIITAIIFAISIAMFIYFMSTKNIIVLQAIVNLNAIVFILIHLIRHKEIINRKALKFLIIGFLFIISSLFLFYNFSSVFRSPFFLIISIVIMILFATSIYMLSHIAKRTTNNFDLLIWFSFIIFIISSFMVLLMPHNKINIQNIEYSVIDGILLFLFLWSTITGYNILKNYDGLSRFVKTIIVFILSETDVVFISIFSFIFIGNINPYILLGAGMLFLGIIFISLMHKEKDVIYDN
jgi:drug/metabolite transporter (DMT)-like permease